MSEISTIEFGEMKSDVKHVKEAVDKIEKSLSRQDNVSRREYKELVSLVQTIRDTHDARLDLLERKSEVEDASPAGLLRKYFNNVVISIIGGGLVAAMLAYANSAGVNAKIDDLQNEIIKTRNYVDSVNADVQTKIKAEGGR